MTKTTFKKAAAIIGAVFVKLFNIALMFAIGGLISEILYESCDWWYADWWMLGGVLAGWQTLCYSNRAAKKLDAIVNNK